MSDFLLLYRLPADSPDMPDSPRRMQERLERWRAWFGELEAKGHLKVLGHPLEMGGAVVKDGGGHSAADSIGADRAVPGNSHFLCEAVSGFVRTSRSRR